MVSIFIWAELMEIRQSLNRSVIKSANNLLLAAQNGTPCTYRPIRNLDGARVPQAREDAHLSAAHF